MEYSVQHKKIAFWKKNYFNVPSIKVTDCNETERKSRFPMPVRACDMDLPGLGNKKTSTPKPSLKFHPIRWQDMDLPELKINNKPKTPISKPTKSTDKAKPYTPKVINSYSKVNNQDSDQKPRRHVRKQLWSEKKTQKRLSIKMKPERRTTIAVKTVIPNININDVTPLVDLKKFEKNPNIFKMQSKKIKDVTDNQASFQSLIRQDLNEFYHKIDKSLKELAEQKELKCDCQVKNDKISNSKIDMRLKELAERIEKIELKCNCHVENDKTSNFKIDMRLNELSERIEKMELKSNCHVENDKISNFKIEMRLNELSERVEKIEKNYKISTQIPKKTKFEILEQKLQQGSPMSDELSLSDTDSPMVKREINSLIHSTIKKSYSTSSLAEPTKKSVHFTSHNDVRTIYEEIRSDASFLCTPKNTTKVKNLMTPSVQNNNKKLISRTIQKQLLLLDDN